MAYKSNIELGSAINRNAMKGFRVYMAIGGMPQAVDRYIATNNFEAVDKAKREILELIESGLVLPCHNVLNPSISLSQTKDGDCFKLYLSALGLFTVMLFNDS